MAYSVKPSSQCKDSERTRPPESLPETKEQSFLKAQTAGLSPKEGRAAPAKGSLDILYCDVSLVGEWRESMGVRRKCCKQNSQEELLVFAMLVGCGQAALLR